MIRKSLLRLYSSLHTFQDRGPMRYATDSWGCPSCRALNYPNRSECFRCKMLRPYNSTQADNAMKNRTGVNERWSKNGPKPESKGRHFDLRKPSRDFTQWGSATRRRCLICYRSFLGDEPICKSCDAFAGDRGKCVISAVLLGDWLCAICNVYNYRHSGMCPSCGGGRK